MKKKISKIPDPSIEARQKKTSACIACECQVVEIAVIFSPGGDFLARGKLVPGRDETRRFVPQAIYSPLLRNRLTGLVGRDSGVIMLWIVWCMDEGDWILAMPRPPKIGVKQEDASV